MRMSRSPDYEVYKPEKNDENLRGTFVSTLLIGGFILAMWLIALYLYIQMTL